MLSDQHGNLLRSQLGLHQSSRFSENLVGNQIASLQESHCMHLVANPRLDRLYNRRANHLGSLAGFRPGNHQTSLIALHRDNQI